MPSQQELFLEINKLLLLVTQKGPFDRTVKSGYIGIIYGIEGTGKDVFCVIKSLEGDKGFLAAQNENLAD